MEYRNDHVLVVEQDTTGSLPGGLGYRIECPNEANGPQGTHGKCGYGVECGCEADYKADAELIAKTVTLLNAAFDLDMDPELPIDEWLSGCYWVLDKRDATPESVRLSIEEHQDCPKTGLPHQEWEGMILTATGPCGWREQFSTDPWSHVEGLNITAPGRYPLEAEWDEDGMYLSHAIESNAVAS